MIEGTGGGGGGSTVEDVSAAVRVEHEEPPASGRSPGIMRVGPVVLYGREFVRCEKLLESQWD